MILAILANINILELIHIRAVCIKLRMVIESLCATKRSLFISSKGLRLKEYWLDLSEFSRFRLKSKRQLRSTLHIAEADPGTEICNFLYRLFPNVERLSIQTSDLDVQNEHYLTRPNFILALLDQWKSNLTVLTLSISFPESHAPNLCNRINQMTKLEHLALGVYIEGIQPELYLLPTVTRLQRFIFRSPCDNSRPNQSALFRHLNPNCTRLFLNFFKVNFLKIHEALLANPRLFARLTHLNLYNLANFGAIRLICEHATKLESFVMVLRTGVRMRHNSPHALLY